MKVVCFAKQKEKDSKIFFAILIIVSKKSLQEERIRAFYFYRVNMDKLFVGMFDILKNHNNIMNINYWK